ncbi:uncharacterized protein LOC100906173 [Galendromus occidentalis]|uniref:Uncharacterized protein LOC100906173 n=1 Tax=Galendromus occidentalis TaxID=34638 RepID=A0AAJ7L764_9ACAR|nr:uncharacterized protein LOC100906173 [Galendromus occidentalis]
MRFVPLSVILFVAPFNFINGLSIRATSIRAEESPSRTEFSKGHACADLADDNYYDIRAESSLYFSADKEARRRNSPVGDNSQLQCQSPAACAYSGLAEQASCFNGNGGDGFSTPDWRCEAIFPDLTYRVYSSVVSCEEISGRLKYCVLRGSCILIYVPYKPITSSVFFFMSAIILTGVFCLLMIVCRLRISRLELQRRDPLQVRSRTIQDEYDSTIDVPPSYNTVERSPTRFKKPFHGNAERALSETPPPEYETCSGEES